MTDKPKLETPTEGVNGMTSLHSAAYSGDLHKLLMSLKNGETPNTQDDNGWTPLHWIVDMSFTIEPLEEMIEALISHGADLNLCAKNGKTPLLMACSDGSERLVLLLLNAGADPTIRTDETTCLHEAIHSPNLVLALLNQGASRTEVDKDGLTALQKAEANIHEYELTKQVVNILK